MKMNNKEFNYIKLKAKNEVGKELIRIHGDVWLILKKHIGTILIRSSKYIGPTRTMYIGDDDGRFEIVGTSNSFKALRED